MSMKDPEDSDRENIQSGETVSLASVSSGAMKTWILFLVHIIQDFLMSPGMSKYGPRDLETGLSCSLRFLGPIREWFCCRSDEVELLIASAVSVCLLCLMFSLHLGMTPTVKLLVSLLSLLPGYVCALLLPNFIHKLCFLGVCALVVAVLLCFCGPFRRVCDCFIGHCVDAIRQYCATGRSGAGERVRGSLQLLSHLVVPGALIVSLIFTVWPKVVAVRLASVVVLLFGVLCVFGLLKFTLASKRDVQRLVWSCYYLYCEVTYPMVAYDLGGRFLGAVRSSWRSLYESLSVSVCSFVFVVLLPLFQKVFLSFEVRRLSACLSDEDYYQVMDQCDGLYTFIFGGLKRERYWWPVLESVLRLLYAEICVLGSSVACLIVGLIFLFAHRRARPYRNRSSECVSVGEPWIICVASFICIVNPSMVRDPGTMFNWWCVASGLSFTVLFYHVSEDEMERDRFFKATLMKAKNKLSVSDEEYERMALVRSCVGFRPDIVVNDSDDLPILGSDELVEGYKGLSDNVVANADRILREEEEDRNERLEASDGSAGDSPAEQPMVGRRDDPCDSDNDLPSSVLVERVEGDIAVILRRLIAYGFPVSLLLFSMCWRSWFAHFKGTTQPHEIRPVDYVYRNDYFVIFRLFPLMIIMWA